MTRHASATMNTFKIKTVSNITSIRKFHQLPFEIYKNDENWAPHPKQDVEAVFDKKKNKYFRHGKCERWILVNKGNKVVGRIAAFVDKKRAFTFNQPTGGIGFFECIDNQTAANMLFDTGKRWLEKEGMEAMDGPINFGVNINYWGLLLDNFEFPSYYGQNYNPPYYKALFENYGFQGISAVPAEPGNGVLLHCIHRRLLPAADGIGPSAPVLHSGASCGIAAVA